MHLLAFVLLELAFLRLTTASGGYVHFDVGKTNRPQAPRLGKRDKSDGYSKNGVFGDDMNGYIYTMNLTIGTPGQKLAV